MTHLYSYMESPFTTALDVFSKKSTKNWFQPLCLKTSEENNSALRSWKFWNVHCLLKQKLSQKLGERLRNSI